MTGIFDTHAHYADSAFDADREQVLEELPRKGVKLVMLAGSSMRDSAANAELAERYDYIYAAAGEIGLDYHYENYDREKQIRFFREQQAHIRRLLPAGQRPPATRRLSRRHQCLPRGHRPRPRLTRRARQADARRHHELLP